MPPPPFNYDYWKKYGTSSPDDPFISAVRDLFVGHQKGTPTSANLKRFWDVAVQLGKKSSDKEEEKKKIKEEPDATCEDSFEDGRKVGFKEGRLAGLSEGKAAGLEEAKKSSSSYSQGYAAGWKAAGERGEERGIETEAKRWVSLGHSLTAACHTEHSITRVAVSVATDTPECPPIPRASTAVQTEAVMNDKVDSVTDYQSVADENPRFDWADDADSLPIPCSAPSRPPRNISTLRTEGVSKPFATLQRRVHHSRHIPQKKQQQKRLCDSQDIYLSPAKQNIKVTSIPPLPLPRKNPPSTSVSPSQSSPTVLDWVHDPRLLKLAHALQDLGWFLPQRIG